MNRFQRILLSLALLAFSIPAVAADRGITVRSAPKFSTNGWGTYHALIIGINDYRYWPQLNTAVKDATVLSQILEDRYGFAPERLILRTDKDATRLRIIRDIRTLAVSVGPEDNLLIYFAGHGQLDDLTGEGYWVPAEGLAKDPGTWISNSFLKSVFSSERVAAKNIVIIADSCYSGTMLRGGQSPLSLDGNYRNRLAVAAARRSRQVISSGGLEPVVDGGAEGHSLFAYYLIKALVENDAEVIDLENLFHTRVWEPVAEISGQRPSVGRLKTPMDDGGQFVLYNQTWRSTDQTPDAAMSLDGAAALQAERQQIEIERQQLEMEKKLLAEQLKIAAERRELANQRQELALHEAPAALPVTAPTQTPADMPAKIEGQPYRIAILPFEILVSKGLGVGGNETVVNGVVDGVSTIENVALTYSYYPQITPGVAPIDLKKTEADGMWKRDGFFGELQPDVDRVVALGRRLGCDAVIMIHAVGRDELRVYRYIIDVRLGTVYKRILEDVNYVGFKGTIAADINQQLLQLSSKDAPG